MFANNPTLKFFIQQVKRYRKETIIGTLLLIVTNALGVYIPIQIKHTIDLFVSKGLKPGAEVWISLAIIASLALVMAAIRTQSRVVLFGIGRRVESDQKQEFYEHLLKLDMVYFNTQRIGDLISRATNDIQAIRQMMGFGLLNLINIVWVYSLTLPLMYSLNKSLTIWIMVGYVPILFFVRLLSIKLKHKQQEAQEKLGSLSSFIEEDINGIQVIKSYSQERREISRFEQINTDYRDVSVGLAQWRGVIWPIMELAKGISFFLLLLYVNQGLLTAGTVAAFLVCLERILFPTAIIGWLITIFQRGSVSVERIQEILRIEPSIINHSPNELKVKDGELKIKDLNLAYEQENLVLKDLTLNVKPGNFVGIVGTIGSGKSTFCNSVMRLLNVPPQAINVDEQDIVGVSLPSLREQVTLVPQETFLFNTTIKQNISFAGEFSEEEIIKAAKDAQLHDEISGFENGYETLVGEKGVSLSGGQAQRVALARAIITNPKILILDDSIASVDNEIGVRILNSLRQRFKEQTLILVTHRISSLKDADEIFVLDNGTCIGSGKHGHLLRTNEVYQKLWKKQKLAIV
ncbi:MAG: ABC transporter ATP-binding protein [Candidatus Caenarcaniphilales bacterium]|nr:ABC transporter ATP-binding protein [Candidatus Caenarcaniphilales bacterium]